jgi:hypothetical protein
MLARLARGSARESDAVDAEELVADVHTLRTEGHGALHDRLHDERHACMQLAD